MGEIILATTVTALLAYVWLLDNKIKKLTKRVDELENN